MNCLSVFGNFLRLALKGLKVLFLLKVFEFLSLLFWLRENVLIRKLGFFEIYDTKNWETNNYNTNIAQYLKK